MRWPLTLDQVRNLMCIYEPHITPEEAYERLVVRFPHETDYTIKKMIDVIQRLKEALPND